MQAQGNPVGQKERFSLLTTGCPFNGSVQVNLSLNVTLPQQAGLE